MLSAAVALVFASGAVLALPSEKPDETPMVNGTVRAIEQVGTNIWLGGKFTQVKQRNGTVVANVSNLAVFDSKTNQYENINLPKLGGTDSEVWDMTLYGKNVLIAGDFSGSSSTQKNLVLVKGAGPGAGRVIRWYNSPSLKSVLAAPKLGRVSTAGDESLSAFERAAARGCGPKRRPPSTPPLVRPRRAVAELPRPGARRIDHLGGMRLRRGRRQGGKGSGQAEYRGSS